MADSASYDVLLKILLVGDTGSNKTELLQEYVKDDKKEEEIGVTGLDYYLKDIVYKGKRIKLQLWYNVSVMTMEFVLLGTQLDRKGFVQ
jgi:GTPase SAR1 family protein